MQETIEGAPESPERPRRIELREGVPPSHRNALASVYPESAKGREQRFAALDARANRDGCETWKPVAGFEWHYGISDHGRVRLDCQTRLHSPGYILKQRTDSAGYPSVSLNNGVGLGSTRVRVHFLVGLAFVGLKPSAAYEVNHRDGNKQNNHWKNLEWVTGARNRQHAFEIGLNHVGERHGQSKLTAELVRYIRLSDKTSAVLGREIGVAEATIRDARRGTTWRHIS